MSAALAQLLGDTAKAIGADRNRIEVVLRFPAGGNGPPFWTARVYEDVERDSAPYFETAASDTPEAALSELGYACADPNPST